MSITDGQWILDMQSFRSGVRPAVSMGLSVTRAGGVGHNKRQKDLAAQTLKLLATYREAEEFAHFGSELAADASRALVTGKRILSALTQSPADVFSLIAQQLMLDIILGLEDDVDIDVSNLKLNVKEYAAQVTKEEDYKTVRERLKATCIVRVKKTKAQAAPETPVAAAPPVPGAKQPKEPPPQDKPKKETAAAGAKK
jgi:F-type H+-transporting ATPase subunit alpha